MRIIDTLYFLVLYPFPFLIILSRICSFVFVVSLYVLVAVSMNIYLFFCFGFDV